MYYKLVEIIEFDANFQMFSNEKIKAVVMANDINEAKVWFDTFARIGLISSIKPSTEVKEANKDEYLEFLEYLK